ncbi:MAG: LuxR C-terminal-related transcriptional regulator [Maribacter litoralis]|uniref:response regulator transcription factor n=1 Tax=Maribacter litoralis TaxID=2059726 RepID=UPI0032978C4E
MIKKLFFIVFIILGFELSAQTAISGFIDMENPHLSDRKIYLAKISIKEMPNLEKAKTITYSTIDEHGFFEFKRSLIDEKEALYRIYVNRFEKALMDTLQVDKLFLFSKRDTLLFKKSSSLFSEYSNTNKADKEWQRLRNYESQLKGLESTKEDSLTNSYIISLKSFSKDSLQTLIVKLIGIKQLENKNLLGKDILKNKEYYVELLSELKESDIDRSNYLFLENKLAFLSTEVAENKFQRSMTVILFLIIAVIGLLIVVFRLNRLKSKPLINNGNLSKQENNIQSLILEGKTNKEIAEELFISLSTVKTHISNIYSKLQVSDRKELLQRYQN